MTHDLLSASDPDPLILTLLLDDVSQDWFDQLRRRHFPPERLQVGAHVTLFHALPGAHAADIVASVAAECSQARPSAVRVSGLRFLGRGVAYALDARDAAGIRRRLARRHAQLLGAQDRAAWSAHVTIQNKVTPEVARATQAALTGLAWPEPITAAGVAVWRYRGGPWEAVSRHWFSQAESL